MDEEALDRLIATVESLHALYEQAKDGDPAALEQLLAQTQAALDQIEQLRSASSPDVQRPAGVIAGRRQPSASCWGNQR